MSDVVWPSAVAGQRIVENSRKDRPGGYSFVTVVATDVENGVEILWRTEGEVRYHPWGEEQVLIMSAKNLPPHLPLRDVPRRTERKITHRTGRRFPFELEIEETTTFADGSTTHTVDYGGADMSLEAMRAIPHEELARDLKRVYEQGGTASYSSLRPAPRVRPGTKEPRR